MSHQFLHNRMLPQYTIFEKQENKKAAQMTTTKIKLVNENVSVSNKQSRSVSISLISLIRTSL